MAAVIGRIEETVSRLLEGTTARLFRVRLQPVQIAKRLIRAMEANQTVSVDRTFAPNSYVVSLGPRDHAEFARFRASLEADLAQAVLAGARERDLVLVAFPRVRLQRAEDLRPGEMRVQCAVVDETGQPVKPEEAAAAPAGHTQILDRSAMQAARPTALRASLEIQGEGRSYALAGATLTIGRGPDNDVVLDDRRVSRRHAEIRLRLGRHTLYDLGSTNGTFVNGRRVSEVVLSDGDRVILGAATLAYHMER